MIKGYFMNKTNTRSVLFIAAMSLTQFACSSKTTIVEADPKNDPLPVEIAAGTAAADPMKGDQWSLAKIQAGASRLPQAAGSYLVKVAMIGSGVDYNHEDLRANIVVNTSEFKAPETGAKTFKDFVDNDGNGLVDDFIGWDFVDNDGLPYDQQGQGTAAAGIIGAASMNGKGIEGINSKVSLIPIRYIDQNGNGTFTNLLNSLKLAKNYKPDVVYVNLLPFDLRPADDGWMEQSELDEMEKSNAEALSNAMKGLAASKTPVVFNAGAQGMDLKNGKKIYSVLARFPNVVFVTSTDDQDKRYFVANYGMQSVHIAAPGQGILTTMPGSQYSKESGTHLAAAHVAGSIALAIANTDGRATMEKLLAALLSKEGGDEIPSLEFEVLSGTRLNTAKFLSVIKQL